MSSKTFVLALFLSPGLAVAQDPETSRYGISERALEVPILVEDLTTSQPAGLVPVTGALGNLELRRALVVDTIAPSSPQVNDLWIDASAGGNYRTCIFTGSGWVETDGSGESCGTIYQRMLDVALTGSGTGTLFSLPGGIACGDACSHPFTLGEAVELFAVPGPDSLFLGWSGCSNELSPHISVLMEDDRLCSAWFATSIGIPTTNWSNTYTLYYDFESLFAAGTTSAAKLVPNLGTAGATCDLRQYGANLPMVLTSEAQEGNFSLNMASSPNGVNQRLGVRMQNDAVNGSCDIARTGNPGTDYGTFTYHSRFLPRLNTESGATLSRVSETANGGPGGWAFEWQESGTIVGRVFTGATQSAVASAPGICPAGVWCVVSLVFDDNLDTFCLYVNGSVAACTAVTTVSEAPTGTTAYFRFGYTNSSSKFDGLIDESGLRLGAAYSAEEACRVCSCGIDGSLCSCDPQLTHLYAAGGGNGLNQTQCGSCSLPACNASAP